MYAAGIKDPLLLDLPQQLRTPRLVLRPPRPGDGAAMNEAVLETIEALRAWMPWAAPTPTAEQSESWCRQSAADFAARKGLVMLMFLPDDTFVGSGGMVRLDWSVPRFEIGYWVRRRFEGQGYVAEAVAEWTRFCFETLSAARVEILMDDGNDRSRRVAERLGFPFEGMLRNHKRWADGTLRHTRVYARTGLT